MARVLVEGTEYTITPDKTFELLQWLNTNGAIRVEGNTEQKFEGKELLNEEGTKQRGVDVGNPKPKPGTDYDFGGTWM